MAPTPRFYTTRAEFLASVGTYIQLPLISPVVTINQTKSVHEETYGRLLTFTFDEQGGVPVRSEGAVTLGYSYLTASGKVLQAATAFGFDIVSADPRGKVHFTVDSKDWPISLDGVSFLGVVSTTPVNMSVHYYPLSSNTDGGDMIGGFTLTNVVIQLGVSDQTAPSAPQGLTIQ